MSGFKFSISVQGLDGKPVAAYIRFTDNKVRKTKEIHPNFMVDYDANRKVVGVEILNPKTFPVQMMKRISAKIKHPELAAINPAALPITCNS
jgi:uncharacterized protein YuzE